MPNGIASSLQNFSPVPPLSHPDDPLGWHEIAEQRGVGRARDASTSGATKSGYTSISGFQDSATSPSGTRIAVHEYALTATADGRTGRLLSLVADPRILPFPECPDAVNFVHRLIGPR